MARFDLRVQGLDIWPPERSLLLIMLDYAAASHNLHDKADHRRV